MAAMGYLFPVSKDITVGLSMVGACTSVTLAEMGLRHMSFSYARSAGKFPHPPMVSSLSDRVTLKVPDIDAREFLTVTLGACIDCTGDQSSAAESRTQKQTHVTDNLHP